MKHLTILIPDKQMAFNTFACVIGAYDIFKRADQFWQEKGKKQLFKKMELAGESGLSAIHHGLLTIKPEVNINAIEQTDLIIIPAISHNFQQPTVNNTALIDWLVAQYKNGAEIASMCTGALILASTGLLDGKNCSIHWNAADYLKRRFPKVIVKPDQLITDEHGIYTNGGGYSFLNLLLYLIEKYYDRETAIYCAKIFQIEIDRQRQSAFTIFKGQRLHGDEVVEKAQDYLEDHFQEKISIEELSQRLAVGRRSFDRRFIKATGNTPIEYLQRVKIESAKKAFETTRKNINEVMYEVGYADEKAFREVFRKITGMSPLDYKKKYNKEMVIE
ncbi:helix-turn-helix domain-containing protein [Olivibacter ginsenosidimutans]|uniref:Helix-turn-helix domain-containing protein n=1 Tax=Olivibacter ginsenosidimutans TaxID=1176537 RepID=A0ABP9APL2_9SPHI